MPKPLSTTVANNNPSGLTRAVRAAREAQAARNSAIDPHLMRAKALFKQAEQFFYTKDGEGRRSKAVLRVLCEDKQNWHGPLEALYKCLAQLEGVEFSEVSNNERYVLFHQATMLRHELIHGYLIDNEDYQLMKVQYPPPEYYENKADASEAISEQWLHVEPESEEQTLEEHCQEFQSMVDAAESAFLSIKKAKKNDGSVEESFLKAMGLVSQAKEKIAPELLGTLKYFVGRMDLYSAYNVNGFLDKLLGAYIKLERLHACVHKVFSGYVSEPVDHAERNNTSGFSSAAEINSARSRMRLADRILSRYAKANPTSADSKQYINMRRDGCYRSLYQKTSVFTRIWFRITRWFRADNSSRLFAAQAKKTPELTPTTDETAAYKQRWHDEVVYEAARSGMPLTPSVDVPGAQNKASSSADMLQSLILAEPLIEPATPVLAPAVKDVDDEGYESPLRPASNTSSDASSGAEISDAEDEQDKQEIYGRPVNGEDRETLRYDFGQSDSLRGVGRFFEKRNAAPPVDRGSKASARITLEPRIGFF